jgi:predicted HicB family RNase H-like nuclease
VIEYKGYLGVVSYDADADAFHGEVVNTRDVITFEGRSVAELKRELAASVEDYLEMCRERGEDPDRPFRGDFLVRADPELHRALTTAAAATGQSLNAFVVARLREAVEDDGRTTPR